MQADLLFVVLSLSSQLYMSQVFGDVWYVSNSGKDVSRCGTTSTKPCRTIRFTILQLNQSLPPAIIDIDSTNGVYENESSTEYLQLNQTITLRSSGSQRAIIKCRDLQSKLYRVVGHAKNPWNFRMDDFRYGDEEMDSLQFGDDEILVTKLTLEGIEIRNCKDVTSSINSVITVVNATVKFSNCSFINNSVIVYHPQTVFNETCSTLRITILNSMFVNNNHPEPFIAAFSLFGCFNISLNVQRSVFQATSFSIKAENSTDISFNDVAVDGQDVTGSQIAVTFSPHLNKISFTNCNVTRQTSTHHSAVSVRVETIPSAVISEISFNRVKFFVNKVTKISGAALSVVSRFTRDPAVINMRLKDCTFHNNSAMDAGGAVYLSKVRYVTFNKCLFVDNIAYNGGAVSINAAQDIIFTGCHFERNIARHTNIGYISSGGAIDVRYSNLTIESCNFTGNVATFSGSAMHVCDCQGLAIRDTSLEASTINDSYSSPYNTLLFVQMADSSTQDPTIRLYRNRFIASSTQSAENNMILITGQTVNDNATVSCPAGQLIQQSIRPAPNSAYPYQYEQQAVWCKPCPGNTFRIRSDTRQLKKYEDIDIPAAVDFTKQFENNDSCETCPSFASCINGVIEPYENYWLTVVDDHVILILCQQTRCARSSNQVCGKEGTRRCCVKERTGQMCSRCSSKHAYAFRLNYSPCVDDKTCWTYSGVSAYAACFILFFFLVLLLMYKIQSNVAESLLKKVKVARGGARSGSESDSMAAVNERGDVSGDDRLLDVGPNDENSFAIRRINSSETSEVNTCDTDNTVLANNDDGCYTEVSDTNGYTNNAELLDNSTKGDKAIQENVSTQDDNTSDTAMLVPESVPCSNLAPANETRYRRGQRNQPALSLVAPDRAESSPDQELITFPQSLTGYIFSIVFFYQLLPIIYPQAAASSISSFDLFIDTLVELFHFSPPLSPAVFCLSYSLSIGRYFVSMTFYWVQLLLVLGLYLLVFCLFSCSTARYNPFREQNIKMIGTHFLAALLFLQILWYIPLLRVSLASVHCINFEDRSVVYDDAEISCFQPWQVFAIIYAILFVIPQFLTLDLCAQKILNRSISIRLYVFLSLFPIFTIVVLPMQQFFGHSVAMHENNLTDSVKDCRSIPPGMRSISQQMIVVIQTVIVQPFRNYYHTSFLDIGYLTVILLRNLLIVIIGSLLSDQPTYRAIALCINCLYFTYDHIAVKPFASEFANHLESVLLVTLSMFSVMNLYAAALYEYSDTVADNNKTLIVFYMFYHIVVLSFYAIVALFVIVRLFKGLCCRGSNPAHCRIS